MRAFPPHIATPPFPIPAPNPADAVTVNLSSYFDNDDFSYDTNRANGNVTGGLSFPAELVSSTVTSDGAYFTMGSFADGSNNAIKCSKETIPITQSKYSSIKVLIASATGDTTDNQSGKFRINYTDGTYSEQRAIIGKWTSTNGNASEQVYLRRCIFTAAQETSRQPAAYIQPI